MQVVGFLSSKPVPPFRTENNVVRIVLRSLRYTSRESNVFASFALT